MNAEQRKVMEPVKSPLVDDYTQLTEQELETACGGASPILMQTCASGQHAMGDGSVRFVRDTISI